MNKFSIIMTIVMERIQQAVEWLAVGKRKWYALGAFSVLMLIVALT